MTGMRVPAATYRLQFNSDFGFAEAEPLILYLDALGITDLYASPILQAREGSAHGYDVTDPRRIDPEVGGRIGFAELSAALKAHRMGLLLDIVPNHMAASTENPWWRDILRWGQQSAQAAKFDINWQGGQAGQSWQAGGESGTEAGKLILPILTSPLDEVLSNEEFALMLGPDGLEILYHEHHLPVCPDSYAMILAGQIPGKIKIPAGGKLWDLYHNDPEAREFVDGLIHFWNNGAGRKRFPTLLAAQHYRPVCWKEKGQRINYRRFFDINDLVTLRIEDEQVFRAVHGRVLEMVRDGAVTGLRIDHVDGLHDPEGYLLRLQEYLAAAPAIDGYADAGFYVLVEKILGRDETLPSGWPVAGTTGYDFLNMLNGLFVDAQGLEELSGFYKKFTGSETELAALVYKQKKLVMRELFAGDMADLTERLLLLAGKDPGSKGGDRGVDGGVDRGVDADDLKAALAGVTAALPVYRTYIRGFSVTLRDRHYIDEALGLAAEYGDGSELARAFLRRVLLLQVTGDMPQETRLDWLAFVMRWQQFSGPIMAKGFEDTALYLDNRLISLNEVGSGAVAGSGTAAGSVAVAEFHRHMLAHQAESPHTMNTTSTHDTKRSEDVRARLNLLSEIPPIWAERVCRWQEWNAPKKPRPAGTPVPHGNEELLLYQTLIGAWPLHRADEAEFMERLAAYLVKASREAKVYTSWLDPNKAYEDAFCAFARLILEESADNRFKEDLLRLVKPLAYYGTFNSLSQLVLKAVSPGVPDFYMGSELWHYSLVDPDNRRPVDFPRRMALLAELRQKEPGAALTLVRDLLQNWDDGRLKLYVTWKALNLRREKAGLFSCGGYLPLEATGAAREHLCALARHAEGDWVVAAVPRLPLRLVSRVSPTAGAAEQTVALTAALTKVKSPTGRECWAETVLHLPRNAPDRWQNIFSGEIYRADRQILPLENVFGIFPVALLTPVSRFL